MFRSAPRRAVRRVPVPVLKKGKGRVEKQTVNTAVKTTRDAKQDVKSVSASLLPRSFNL